MRVDPEEGIISYAKRHFGSSVEDPVNRLMLSYGPIQDFTRLLIMQLIEQRLVVENPRSLFEITTTWRREASDILADLIDRCRQYELPDSLLTSVIKEMRMAENPQTNRLLHSVTQSVEPPLNLS